MSTATAEWWEIDLSEMKAAFDGGAWARGRAYAYGGHVLTLDWDPEQRFISASVAGQDAVYETVAYFDDTGERVGFVEGECSCPVGWNCKHVAAVVIAAASQGGPESTDIVDLQPAADGPVAGAGEPGPRLAAWELSLRTLVAARELPATGAPLAIEVGLIAPRYPDNGQPRLNARLMRPGARSGWVNGSLNWGGYEWQLRNGGYRDDHVTLMQELYALCRRRDPYVSYYSSERAIDLADCDSPQLWALLDEAARLDLPLIHAHQTLGEIPPYIRGELVLDVTREGADLKVAAVLDVESPGAEDLVPVRFIGRPGGHGIVCAERADVDAGLPLERWRLRLVRLGRVPAPQLTRMLLGGERLVVPGGEERRFSEELCPPLRHIAPIVSSDGSFEPPEVSDPALVLLVRYGDSPQVEAAWAWEYEIAGSARRVPLGGADGAAGFRDHDAERGLLREVTLPVDRLQPLGLVTSGGRPAEQGPIRLRGSAAVQLATEVLPALADHPAVRVEITGEMPDFRDVGESLQVGLSTHEIAGDRDWFGLGVTIVVEGREVPFVDVFSALALGETQMLLDDGAYFSLEDPRLQQLRQLIEEARALDDPASASLRISRYQADLWAELVALGVVTAQADRWRRVVAPLLELTALPQCPPPEALVADLRAYQTDGVSWLATLWELELGGILADDMGLGKTLQTLALICHARQREAETGPFLVVAPTSVAPNWAAEAARFAPSLRVEVVLDTLARSGRDLDEVSRADVVITTYTLFRLDFEAYRRVPWAALVLDEAQFVKNHRAKTYRCARELDTPFKLAITGTPMENNLMELWAMLSLVAPGLFPDPQRFAQHYARPIERNGDRERLAILRRRIRPLVKRRTKELVANELPPKQEQTVTIDLHPRHRRLYDTHLQRERARLLRLLDDFDRNRVAILASITRLRQLSLHPALVDAGHETVPCAKLDALIEHLDDVIANGHRALVFSQFTQFLGRVRSRLDAAGIDCSYLDGSTRRRGEVLESFRRGDAPVFLISLKAGWGGPEPDRSRLLLPARPLVESGCGDPGRRPHAPHRPDSPGHGLPADLQGHDRGEGAGAG